MKTQGIRILDKIKKVSSVSLSDLLNELEKGNELNWLITFFYATGNLDDGTSTTELEQQVNEAENGLFLSWAQLLKFSQKYVGLRDITLIGAREPKNLIRYAQNLAMYESCEVVIEKVESEYWEVFCQDQTQIEMLAKKFLQVEFLKPDFLKEE